MLTHRGINYDTGLNYVPGTLSRTVWDPIAAERDFQCIAGDLACNAVSIFGSDLTRLESAAKIAAGTGLEVWLQPRLIDRPQSEVLAHLEAAADIAEGLRSEGASIVLHVGCELSIFLPGLIPGDSYEERIETLSSVWPAPDGWDESLNAYLTKAMERARQRFDGPLIYAAGEWEAVDWHSFDIVGVNLYREEANKDSYREILRGLKTWGKPVVITEFGICSYAGADAAGGGGHDIIDFSTVPPSIDAGLERDERLQASHLQELIAIYRQEGINGCFVFAFSEPSNPWNESPALDLDKASYGIVRIQPGSVTGSDWTPKLAFHSLGDIYREAALHIASRDLPAD